MYKLTLDRLKNQTLLYDTDIFLILYLEKIIYDQQKNDHRIDILY